MADNDVVLKDYAATPLSFNPRTIDRGSGVRENVNSLAKVDGTRINPATDESIGAAGTSPPALANSASGVIGWLRKVVDVLVSGINVFLPADQDPVLDNANGVKVTLTASTSTALSTPPTGCKYLRVTPEVDAFLHTLNGTAGDLATNIKIAANTSEVIPVTAGSIVNVFSTTAGIVRATPLKVR